MKDCSGVWTAIVTPFTKNGGIDWSSFERLLARQVEAGVSGVVVAGTTGEAPTLEDREKLELFKFARNTLPKGVLLMAGTGTNNTDQSVRLSAAAEEIGCDALLVVTPPYNKPTLSGLKAHFGAIANTSKLPICVYHVPGRTGQRLSPEQIGELSQCPHVTSVKEASGDLALFSKARQLSSAAFLSGDDFTYLPSLAVGGRGVISVMSNVFPKETVALQKSFDSGENAKALKIHEALFPAIEGLFCESNPGPAKSILSDLGLCSNYLRLPLVSVSPENARNLKDIYQETLRKLKSI